MSERSLGYALFDNVIGDTGKLFNLSGADDHLTPGERLGAALSDDPVGVGKSIVEGVTGSVKDFATRVREEGPASALTGSLQDYSESILGAGLNLSSGTQGYMDRGMTQAEARDAQLGDAMLVSELIPLVGSAGYLARAGKSAIPKAPSDPSRRDFMAKGAAAAGVAAIMPEELLKQAGKALKPAAATKVIPSVIDVFSQNMKILRKERDEAYDAADEVFDEQEAGYLSSDSLSDNAKALYEEQLIKAERLHAELDATTEQELREVISDMGPKDIKEASDESLEELSNALNDFRSISEQEFIEQMIPLSEEIKKRGLLNLKNEKGIFQYPNARTVVEDVEDFKVGENRDPFGGLKSDKKFAEGGEVMNRMEQGIASIPRQTVIRDQPHMLAYITPAEAMLLKQNGGSGLPSHGGVPEFGFWSSTFGGGNSFDQSVQNAFGGNDGGSFVGGEWQGNTGDNRPESGVGSYMEANQGNSGGGATAPTRRVNNAGNGYEVGDRVPIQGPTSFFDSNLNKPPEGWAAYHGGSAGNSSDNDDISRAGMMGSGVNMAVNPNVIPVDDVATVEPVRSGVPEFVAGETPRPEQAMISDILKPAQYASFEPNQNNPYMYQELLNMYKNPYA